jgi:uncharacterized membrane protein required for colicin V production
LTKVSVAIDAVLVLIVAVTAYKGWRKGFIRGVFGVVAVIVSIFGANLVAKAYSGEFTEMLEPLVGGVVDSAISTVIDAEGTTSDRVSVYDVSYNALKRLGVAEDAAVELAEKVAAEFSGVGQVMSDGLTQKLCHKLAYVAVFLVVFILISILFAVLGNLINFVFSLPGLALPDHIIGLVLGLAKGLIIVFVIAVAMRYLGIVSGSVIGQTKVLQYILNANPLAKILGL